MTPILVLNVKHRESTYIDPIFWRADSSSSVSVTALLDIYLVKSMLLFPSSTVNSQFSFSVSGSARVKLIFLAWVVSIRGPPTRLADSSDFDKICYWWYMSMMMKLWVKSSRQQVAFLMMQRTDAMSLESEIKEQGKSVREWMKSVMRRAHSSTHSSTSSLLSSYQEASESVRQLTCIKKLSRRPNCLRMTDFIW